MHWDLALWLPRQCGCDTLGACFAKKYLVVAMLEVGAAKKGKTLVSYYEQRKLKLS